MRGCIYYAKYLPCAAKVEENKVCSIGLKSFLLYFYLQTFENITVNTIRELLTQLQDLENNKNKSRSVFWKEILIVSLICISIAWRNCVKISFPGFVPFPKRQALKV